MAWEVPNFMIPVQVNQGGQIASYADRLMGAYDQGRAQRQQQDVLNARKSLGQGGPMNPDGTPNYASRADILLGSGDLDGANTMMRLGQQEVQNNFERQRLDLMRQRVDKDAHPTYGLNPQFAVDANGNPVMLQLGSNGTVRQAQTPPGVTLSRQPIVSDAGTHYVVMDPITKQVVNTIPKNVAGASAAKAVGTAAGEAQAQLPGAESMTSQINQQVWDLANDPYLPNMLGPLASRMPNMTTDAARVQGRMDQLRGGVFLQGFQMLKGGGAITEVEGQKAEQAMARLSAAQNIGDYRQALGEFRDALTAGLAKLRAQGAMVPGVSQGFGAPGGGQPAATPSFQPNYAPGAGPSNPPAGMPQGASGQGASGPAPGGDPLAQARAAISRGANRDAVIQRLQQMGVNPAGL